MRVLITGGAGFIGSSVADAYLAAGHQVAILDNLVTGQREFINPQSSFFEGDIEDAALVERLLTEFKPEVINHHAAQVDVRHAVSDPQFDARVNILGSLNLIEGAIKHGVTRFIYANSGGAGYGDPAPADLPCKEETPIHPISPYGVSKMTVEAYLFARRRTHGLHYVALRYGNVFGPRQTFGEAGVCAIFTHQMLNGGRPVIYGDGTAERDYCYIEDVVAANLLALTHPAAAGAYNVGTGSGVSTRAVFDAVKAATGFPGEPELQPERPGEVAKMSLDAGRLKRELGWQSSVSFKEGIERTVAWMRSQRPVS